METIILSVHGMSCEHCAKAVTNDLLEVDGIKDVTVDLKGKSVTVKYDVAKVGLDIIKSTITETGYEVK